jgi:hypothetical protein
VQAWSGLLPEDHLTGEEFLDINVLVVDAVESFSSVESSN